ncbi:MAG: hypothetical protein HYV07_14760 [Deltaproteobacteria bacterium]|nr:hypothetical protein [Deltaproteobacteria bacterium]
MTWLPRRCALVALAVTIERALETQRPANYGPSMKLMRFSSTALAICLAACGSAPRPKPPAPPPARSTAPSAPTKTDFEEIAKKLMARCVSGGWIERWRSEGDVDAAKPKVFLEGFDDQTGQGLDPTYLMSVLEKRMRLSGVYELVPSADGADFVAHGKILRLAERAGAGRISVYTAVLGFKPASGAAAASCEATVQGEL